LLLFSVFFVVVFLIIPPVLVYGFAVVIVKVFQTVKIVREE
jgi:type III secretory pathway component EscS